jgi:hypothetical protein
MKAKADQKFFSPGDTVELKQEEVFCGMLKCEKGNRI